MSAIGSILAQFGYFKQSQETDFSKVEKVEFSKVSFHLDKRTPQDQKNAIVSEHIDKKHIGSENFRLRKDAPASNSQKTEQAYNQLKQQIKFENPYDLAEIAEYVEVAHLETQTLQNSSNGYYIVVNGANQQVVNKKAFIRNDFKKEKILKAYSSEQYRIPGKLVNLVA